MAQNNRKRACEMARDERVADYTAYRIRYLPTAIDNARRNLAALENEARRLGLPHLLEDGR
jgi:hypothetical protein